MLILKNYQTSTRSAVVLTNRVKKFFLLLIFALFFASASAQHTLVKTSDEVSFKTGLELLDKKKYGAARSFFERFVEQNKYDNKSIDASYYIAFSALNLFNPDAEALFEEFILRYPYHSKASSAYYDLGTFYYNNKSYEKTILYLEKVNFSQLSGPQSTEAKFRLAYSYFSQKDFDKAGPLFKEIKASDHKYTFAASYYSAYIEYRNDEFEAALNDLKKAEQSEAYKNLVPLMVVNIYYKKGDYNQMLEYAEGVLKKGEKIQGADEIFLLVAEAYFRKKEYKSAAENFQKYLTEMKGKANTDIQYRLAYSLYQAKDYAEAANNFKVIASPKDSLGQAASYYLGLAYVKTDNKPFALTAFDQARKGSFNQQVREEALFNYAKINYDLERYGDAVTLLKEFAKSFPRSQHNDEVQDLFSEALLRTNNYSEGLTFIENLKSRSLRVNTAYQRMALYKGIELFNNDQFLEAIELFNKSLEYTYDKETFLAATFWKAEAFSVLKDYLNAITTYAVVFQKTSPAESEFHLKSRYGIGYAYYNTQQYDKALPHFKEYTNQLKDKPAKQNYNDALLRLADLYYVTKQYSEALKNYDQAIAQENKEKDYAYFQKGVVLGITGKLPEAITSFDEVIKKYPASLYFDDAVFQKAVFEFENSEYFNAVQGFTRIISTWPSSGFVPYAYLKRAIAYSNVQKYPEAVSDYKVLMDKYPDHPVAKDALLGLQESLAASGKAEELSQILSKYKALNPQSDALVNIEFENAKSLYNDQKYDKAIEAFNNYQKSYPDNSNIQELKYYLAESYFRLKDNNNALAQYRIITDDKTSPYYSRAIQRIGELEFANKSYASSKNFYQLLLQVSKNKKERSNAWMGLMESYYYLNSFDSSLVFAGLILENGNASIDAENKALLYQGKIAYAQQKFDLALDYFLNAINNAKDENAAEAMYLVAEIQRSKQQNKQSNETLFELNNTFPTNTNWLGKSFLLIAENYISLNEIFQARATLNSIIEKSPNKASIDKAKTLLDELDKKEKSDKSEKTGNE